MVVIHVSGTTGSGKSWLGELMKRIYPDSRLHVVDLDIIFKSAMGRSTNMSDKISYIENFVQTHIKKLRGRYQNLLITGYSDVMIDRDVHYVELGADHKYFIDLPVDQLIQQYRRRASHYIASTNDEARVLSDTAIRKMALDDRRIYRDYKRLPQMRIVKDIILIIGK